MRGEEDETGQVVRSTEPSSNVARRSQGSERPAVNRFVRDVLVEAQRFYFSFFGLLRSPFESFLLRSLSRRHNPSTRSSRRRSAVARIQKKKKNGVQTLDDVEVEPKNKQNKKESNNQSTPRNSNYVEIRNCTRFSEERAPGRVDTRRMSRRRRGRWIGVAREVGGSLVDFNDALHEVRIQRGTDHETCSREVSRSYAGIFRFTRNGDCSPTRREEHVEQENAYLTLGLGCRGHFFFLSRRSRSHRHRPTKLSPHTEPTP